MNWPFAYVIGQLLSKVNGFVVVQVYIQWNSFWCI